MRNTDTPGLVKIFISVLATLLTLGCASVQQPKGGPRDTLPPKLLNAIPKNLTTKFSSEKIIFTFDEYFNLKNEFKEVTISPEMEKPPLLKKQKKQLEVLFQQPLEKNTTYTLNFGNAIVDINEGNELKNFTYVFSTGDTLDSLQLSGHVINSFTGLPEMDASVFIIPIVADTAFGKKKPSIYTRTDSAGRFQLKNLRKDTYNVYALKEQNNDRLYMQGTEYIGFIKSSIELNKNIDTIKLAVFKEMPKEFRVLDRKINPDGTVFLTFNKPIRKPTLKIVFPAGADATKKILFSHTLDTARLWVPDMSFDSLKIDVSDNGKILQTINITRAKKETYTRTLIPGDNLDPSSNLYPATPLALIFPSPITTADKEKITLLQDSIPQTNFTLKKDTSNFLTYRIDYPFKEKRKYEIRVAEGAFTDFFGSRNKYFTKKFQILTSNDFGKLTVKVTLPEKSKQYIFELVNELNNVAFTTLLRSDTTMLLPNNKTGKYRVRIIYDDNKNGIWDTGSLLEKKFPEKIWLDPRSFSIRPNWDIVQIIIIPK